MKPRILSTARLSFSFATAIAALFAGQSAHATPYFWNGATTGTWNTAGNWSGIVIPGINDDLTILGPSNVAGALTIDFDADNSARSLIFTNTAATSITNTTSGANKTLTLGSGGITTGAGAVQIGSTTANQAVNITLGAAQTWNIGAGGMTVTNLIGGTSTGLTKTGAGNLLINTGAANGFTGGVTVNAGTLTASYANFNGNQLLSSSNSLTIGGSGTFSLVGNNTAAAANIQTFANTTFNVGRNNIVIAKGTSGASVTLNLGVLTVNPGSVTAFSPTTAWTTTASTTERVFITAGGSVPTLPGSGSQFINGVFYRASAAAGQARWAAVNSSGQLLAGPTVTTLAAGTSSNAAVPVQFNGTASIALTNTSLSTYGLLLNTGSAGLSLTLAASGTYTLNSIIQQQSVNGVSINAGTGTSNIIIGSERNLVLNMDNSAGLTINAPIANNGGGASSVTIASTAPSGTTPGNIAFGGANTYSGATYVMNGTLTLTNALALQNTSGITLGGASAATLTSSLPAITISAPITTANTGITSTISYYGGSGGGSIALDGAIGGNGNVAYTTPNASSGGNQNSINLGAAGTYAGSTNLNTGNINNNLTLRNSSSAANVLPTSTVLTFGTGAGPTTASRTTTFDLNGQNQTLAGLGSLAAVAVPNGRNHRVSSTAAATLTINSTADQTFGGTTVAGSLTTNAQIAGAISLVKNGAGTFTLGGLLTGGATASGNTFTGSTSVLGGILVLGESTSIRNSAYDTTASVTGTSTAGLRTTVTTLTLGGLTGNKNFADVFTTTIGGYGGLTTLTLNPGTSVTNSYAADIGDGATGLTLSKSGAGTQVLAAAQTFTGGVTINAGTLALGNAGALNSTVGSENAVAFGASSTGTLALAGNSVVVANLSTNATPGTTFVQNANGASVSNATLTVGNSSNLSGTYVGTIQDGTGGGTLALTKAGSGTLTLSGANTYTGDTTISAGGLQLGADSTTGSLSTSSAIVNNGSLTIKRSNAVVQGTDFSGADITGTGSFTQAGSGTTTLNIANSYSGGTTVTAGTLALTNASAAGTAGISISGASTATLQIDAGITLAGNNITFSNTNAASSVKHDVAALGTYTTGTSGNLTSSFVGGQADTTAQILTATDTSNSVATNATTLTMSFSGTSAANNDSIRRSDVFTLTGTGTDAYVLQLFTGTLAADNRLGWLNGGNDWVNVGTGTDLGVWNIASTYTVGDYGYDSGTGSVWAVVGNQTGSFSVIPEPTSALAGLLIGAGLLRRRRSA